MDVFEMEERINLMEASLDAVEAHYSLALRVVEAVDVYVKDPPGPEGRSLTRARFDDVVSVLDEFNSYQGPLSVDAVAGGRASMSVPSINAVTATSSSQSAPPKVPYLRIVGKEDV